MVVLRDVQQADLAVFFAHQLDPAAHRMAAFTPRDRRAFLAHWQAILSNQEVFGQAIVWGDKLAGYVVCFEQSEQWLVGYWIGREFWGRGIATRALQEFLGRIEHRPLYAYVAKANIGSIRVLEKSGFSLAGEGLAAPLSDGTVVEEFVYSLAE